MASRDEVNALLKRINIKGKEYVDVASRVQGFWKIYPDGSIKTELISFDGNECIFKAEVWNKDVLLATAHAHEVKGSSNINKTSFVENCETSAVGRALGNAGIGSTDSIASADEVLNAQAAQEHAKPKDGRASLMESLKTAKTRAVSLGIKADAMGDYLENLCDGFKRDESGGWLVKGMTDPELKAALEYIEGRIKDMESLKG